jgi:hypothetical protein
VVESRRPIPVGVVVVANEDEPHPEDDRGDEQAKEHEEEEPAKDHEHPFRAFHGDGDHGEGYPLSMELLERAGG